MPDPPPAVISGSSARQEDLVRHPVLAELTAAQQHEVLQRADVIRLKRQQPLFRMGDPATHFFLCRSGQLKLYRITANGNEKIIGLVNPGSSFAEAAAFMPRRTYPVSCTALRASELVRFNTQHLIGLLRESPDSCIRLLGVISGRLWNRVADIEALSLQNSQLRIVNYLLRLHREAADGIIELPTSKKYVASLLAVQPETLSRVLTRLQQEAIVTMTHRHLEILDPARMSAIAEGREPGIMAQEGW
jgi:CRP-like cAMP-binding protein